MNNQGGEQSEVEYKPEDSSEKKLRDFKDEIRTLKAQEQQVHDLRSGGNRDFNATWHFGDVNPDELCQEDMEMWEIIKRSLSGGPPDTLTLIFKDYQKRVQTSGNKSRGAFSAFVGNKLGVIVLGEDIKKFGIS